MHRHTSLAVLLTLVLFTIYGERSSLGFKFKENDPSRVIARIEDSLFDCFNLEYCKIPAETGNTTKFEEVIELAENKTYQVLLSFYDEFNDDPEKNLCDHPQEERKALWARVIQEFLDYWVLVACRAEDRTECDKIDAAGRRANDIITEDNATGKCGLTRDQILQGYYGQLGPIYGGAF